MVSVIIIFFNAERFLREAMESVFAQTYQSWELLLVDDGSTDAGTKLAQDCAAQHPDRVRYLQHEGHQNRGLSISRNLGIAHARGEFVSFLDSDDVWLPEKLESEVAILGQNPDASIVYGATCYWYSWTGKRKDFKRDFVQDPDVKLDTIFRPPSLLFLVVPLGNAPCPTNLLFRREALVRIGGFEEEFTGLYEDQVFLVKAFLKESTFVSGKCWSKYRLHEESCVSVAERTGRHHALRVVFLRWLEGYFSKEGLQDTEVWHALQKLLWRERHPLFLAFAQFPARLLKKIARWILPADFHRRLRSKWKASRERALDR